MSSPSKLTIAAIEFWPVDLALTDVFTISKGSVGVAENIFIKLTLEDGSEGYGEIAPFTALTGENRDGCLSICREVAPVLLDKTVARYRDLSFRIETLAPEHPAVRCGFETAVLDALTRSLGIPLWSFWGGAVSGPLETDMTIPILSRDRSLALAGHWYGLGFRTIKLKVGGDLDKEVALAWEIHKSFPGVSFIFDANQGFDVAQSRLFLKETLRKGLSVTLLEQPVARDDLDGMAALRAESVVPIAADESVFTRQDAGAVIRKGAADVINLKITKSGGLATLDIAAAALTAGMKLMIGGMVESRLAMACSLSMALGTGGISFLDLDTPLLMKEDAWRGGYRYSGPLMSSWPEAGLGMVPCNDSARLERGFSFKRS